MVTSKRTCVGRRIALAEVEASGPGKGPRTKGDQRSPDSTHSGLFTFLNWSYLICGSSSCICWSRCLLRPSTNSTSRPIRPCPTTDWYSSPPGTGPGSRPRCPEGRSWPFWSLRGASEKDVKSVFSRWSRWSSHKLRFCSKHCPSPNRSATQALQTALGPSKPRDWFNPRPFPGGSAVGSSWVAQSGGVSSRNIETPRNPPARASESHALFAHENLARNKVRYLTKPLLFRSLGDP